MKRILFILILIGLIIPSVGWTKEWVFWFHLPRCNKYWAEWNQYWGWWPSKAGITCKYELWIRKNSDEVNDLKIRFLLRNERGPYKKIPEQFLTEWLIQSEESAVFKLEDFFEFSDLNEFKILEVKIISKYLPYPHILLKNPFGEDFEVIDLEGNPLTLRGPGGETIIPEHTLTIEPIHKK